MGHTLVPFCSHPPKNGTNRMFFSKYGNISKMTHPKKRTTAFMISRFHGKNEITKQFYRKITSCRQQRITYPLVICYITVENKPFSSLIYLFKMVIIYSYVSLPEGKHKPGWWFRPIQYSSIRIIIFHPRQDGTMKIRTI